MNRNTMKKPQPQMIAVSNTSNPVRGYEQVDLPIEVLESAIMQRPLVDKNVREIKEKYDPNKVHPLCVSFRDGQYHVFDGAHTLAAIKEMFGEENVNVPCLVYNGLTVEQEAALFATQYENCTQVPFLYRMHANKYSNDPKYAAFRAITESEGFTLSEDGRVSDYTIGAIKKAWTIFTRNGPILYQTVLRLVRRTWNGVDWSLQARILGGVATFVKQYPNFNEERFIRNLSTCDYKQIAMGTVGLSLNKDIAFAVAIAKSYNTHGGRNVVNINMLLV